MNLLKRRTVLLLSSRTHAAAQPSGGGNSRQAPDPRVQLAWFVEGLLYIGTFFAVLFAHVHIHTHSKTLSLDTWMLTKRKEELVGEVNSLRMRIVPLESPLRIETLAVSELGMSPAAPEPGKKPGN